MGFAKHLTILNIRRTPFAPCCNMVCIHLVLFPYTTLVSIITNSTERAVWNTFILCLFCLFRVNTLFGRLIKNTNIQKFRIYTTSQDIFIYAFVILNIIVTKQCLNLAGTSCGLYEFLWYLSYKSPQDNPHIVLSTSEKTLKMQSITPFILSCTALVITSFPKENFPI